MKVMRLRGVAAIEAGEVGEAGDEDGGLIALADLQMAVCHEEGFAGNERAVRFEEFFFHEQIGDAGLVFERDETMAFGGAGALATDDQACDDDGDFRGEEMEVAGALDFEIGFLAPKFHWMWAGGRTLGGDVG